MDDSRLRDAKAIPIMDIAGRLDLQGLGRAGHEWVGPCPACGGTDRFGINPIKGVWNCRHGCSEKGADGIALVQVALACDFKAALAYLVGEADVQVSGAERQRRDEEAAKQAKKRADDSARHRSNAIKAANGIWIQTKPAAGTAVSSYLDRRGLPEPLCVDPPRDLRFHPALRYTVQRAGEWVTIHEGPAMVAAVRNQAGELTAIHRTWIDLDQPKGKAVLPVEAVDNPKNDGATWPAKKMLGSKKGGAIRLTPHPARDIATIVMAEGIETTLTALAANPFGSDAAFWCGADLGNMAGRRQSGKGLKFAGIPDIEDDEAFVPPPWLKRLIFVMDGDSEPRLTRAQCLSGLRRAKHFNPALDIRLVEVPVGMDLNDMLLEAANDPA